MPAIELLSKTGLSDSLLKVIEGAPLPGIDTGPKDEETRSALRIAIREEGCAGTLQESGLWLLAGELDLSHEVSQSDGSAEGSFWHGIMHRREGDFGNAKYWFRRAGNHPVHQELANHIERSASSLASDLPTSRLQDAAELPSRLVDLCEQATHGKPDWRQDLERICWWEWELLFNFVS